MAAASAPRRRRRTNRRRRRREEDQSNDRWLLTYADMITLLMALFMVLFSISSLNQSKYETLESSLREAFSGSVLPGGTSILETGGSTDNKRPPPESAVPALAPDADARRSGERAAREQEDFEDLKRKLDAYAWAHGLEEDLRADVERRGLVIRLLTDRVLFDSGEAVLKPRAGPILRHIARLLVIDRRHPIAVEGHTDDVPIRTAVYPSNWELSGARASSVVRFLINRSVRPRRMEATGFADLHPISTNRTARGRYRNRRVEIVLTRLGHGGPAR